MHAVGCGKAWTGCSQESFKGSSGGRWHWLRMGTPGPVLSPSPCARTQTAEYRGTPSFQAQCSACSEDMVAMRTLSEAVALHQLDLRLTRRPCSRARLQRPGSQLRNEELVDALILSLGCKCRPVAHAPNNEVVQLQARHQHKSNLLSVQFLEPQPQVLAAFRLHCSTILAASWPIWGFGCCMKAVRVVELSSLHLPIHSFALVQIGQWRSAELDRAKWILCRGTDAGVHASSHA